MIIDAFRAKDNSFHWIDVVDPSGGEFEILSQKYGLHTSSIQACLDPAHLPKFELIQNHIFIMLRIMDENASPEANTLRALTQKIAIFIGNDYLITIHRRDSNALKGTREKWVKTLAGQTQNYMPQLLAHIVNAAFQSFNHALSQAENKLEEFEILLAKDKTTSASIQEKFILKGQAYVFKRVLRLSLDLLPKLKIVSDYDPILYEDIKQSLETSYFETENILEHVNNLITLHLSLASHHTNDIVRVLTMFSVFFLPSTFMINLFTLHYRWSSIIDSPYVVWAVLIGLFLILYHWFRTKEWL